MTPLARLLAAVEAGPLWLPADLAISKRVSKMINAAFPDDEDGENFCAAYGEGDVTAAISLCGAMLPDGSSTGGTNWSKRLDADRTDHNGKEIWTATIHDGTSHTSCDVFETADSSDPARALLIAMLRAMVAREGGDA